MCAVIHNIVMQIRIPAYVLELMNRLYENGYECYVVGGAVRSAYLGLPVHDYDLTTNALPEQMQAVFSDYKTGGNGIRHGTLIVISHHIPVEITTYRKDDVYLDHRHPDSVSFSPTVKEDLSRRDFTVNAMCYSPREGVLDYFGGREDLQAKIIRCIGRAQDRFDEDALRILRALRFAARLSFSIEEKTADALRKKKELLKYISTERIHDEMDGFLKAPGCTPLLHNFREVFEVFLPEVKKLDDSEWDRLCDAVDRCAPKADLRMAVILSRITEQPDDILKRMKYSNSSIRMITNLTSLQNMPAVTRIDLRRILNRLTCDYHDYSSFRHALDPQVDEDRMNELFRMITEDGDCCSLRTLAVSGNDLKDMGFKGADIARILNLLLNAVMEDRAANERTELLALAAGQK